MYRKIFSFLIQRRLANREAAMAMSAVREAVFAFSFPASREMLAFRFQEGKLTEDASAPDLIISLGNQELLRLLRRKVSLEELYFERRLEVRGNYSVFQALAAVFS